jgi:hypothetical protein
MLRRSAVGCDGERARVIVREPRRAVRVLAKYYLSCPALAETLRVPVTVTVVVVASRLLRSRGGYWHYFPLIVAE